MKAAPFDYVRAQNLAHALDKLSESGGDAKLIAGGQSLVPMMAMRLARPALLIDINRLDELKNIEILATHVKLGAGVRHTAILPCADAGRAIALYLGILLNIALTFAGF